MTTPTSGPSDQHDWRGIGTWNGNGDYSASGACRRCGQTYNYGMVKGVKYGTEPPDGPCPGGLAYPNQVWAWRSKEANGLRMKETA